MIYLDSSVALAYLYEERRRPEDAFWRQPIQSSRLLEYEIWNRLHASGRADAARAAVVQVFAAVTLLDMSPQVLLRALRPFPVAVRTLDGIHLATMDFLRQFGRPIELASYDARLIAAAAAIGIEAVAM